MNVADTDVALPGSSSRRAGRAVEFHRPIAARPAQLPTTSGQSVDAPAPSGLFRDVIATFGSVNFPMEVVDDDELPPDGGGS